MFFTCLNNFFSAITTSQVQTRQSMQLNSKNSGILFIVLISSAALWPANTNMPHPTQMFIYFTHINLISYITTQETLSSFQDMNFCTSNLIAHLISFSLYFYKVIQRSGCCSIGSSDLLGLSFHMRQCSVPTVSLSVNSGYIPLSPPPSELLWEFSFYFQQPNQKCVKSQ